MSQARIPLSAHVKGRDNAAALDLPYQTSPTNSDRLLASGSYRRVLPMQYTTLGRTGLTVSVAGLGCGGFSRLGLGSGQSAAHAVGIVRQALDLGVTLIDTAAAYGTED